MNYHSFYEKIRSAGSLILSVDGKQYTVLFPFVGENRKVGLFVESEEVFFEDTDMEIESKKISVLTEPIVEVVEGFKLKSVYGTLIDGNKLLLNKVSCAMLSIDKASVDMRNVCLENSKKALEEAISNIILNTSAYMSLRFPDLKKSLLEGVTYFGYIEGVKEVVERKPITLKDVMDNACNREETETFFRKYMEALEVYCSNLTIQNLTENA